MSKVNDLTLRQLEYVVAVADTLRFHKAAAHCHVSQPTLSAQIRQLEDVLNVQLFERDRRRVLVTATGRDIVERARRVLFEASSLVDAAVRAREPFRGTFRIGVITTVSPYLLPEVMPGVTTRYPDLLLAFREDKTANILEELAAGSLDAGILALDADTTSFEQAELFQDPFVAAFPRGHPLTKKKRIAMGDLKDSEVLLLDEGHCFRAQALSLCTKALAKETSFRATSLSVLVQMVALGAGITLLPSIAEAVENRCQQIEVRSFVKPTPGRSIGLIWRTSSPFGAVFRELATSLRGVRDGTCA